ncbi:MAG: hypothetical protein IMZ53_17100 [Thermoplasmata archaeon]|nr:hypothetical protein [Thermoplasmata archaeon]MBE3142291.1 hypothetical protein [Thermoplasmata archaeon]
MENIPNNNVLVVGFIGHTSIENLSLVKKQVDQIPGLKIVFFKASSDKLWIKEGDAP